MVVVSGSKCYLKALTSKLSVLDSKNSLFLLERRLRSGFVVVCLMSLPSVEEKAASLNKSPFSKAQSWRMKKRMKESCWRRTTEKKQVEDY